MATPADDLKPDETFTRAEKNKLNEFVRAFQGIDWTEEQIRACAKKQALDAKFTNALINALKSNSKIPEPPTYSLKETRETIAHQVSTPCSKETAEATARPSVMKGVTNLDLDNFSDIHTIDAATLAAQLLEISPKTLAGVGINLNTINKQESNQRFKASDNSDALLYNPSPASDTTKANATAIAAAAATTMIAAPSSDPLENPRGYKSIFPISNYHACDLKSNEEASQSSVTKMCLGSELLSKVGIVTSADNDKVQVSFTASAQAVISVTVVVPGSDFSFTKVYKKESGSPIVSTEPFIGLDPWFQTNKPFPGGRSLSSSTTSLSGSNPTSPPIGSSAPAGFTPAFMQQVDNMPPMQLPASGLPGTTPHATPISSPPVSPIMPTHSLGKR